MKNLILSPPNTPPCIQPVANYMLHLPRISSEIAECLDGRAVATLANGSETLSWQEVRDFEQGFVEEFSVMQLAMLC